MRVSEFTCHLVELLPEFVVCRGSHGARLPPAARGVPVDAVQVGAIVAFINRGPDGVDRRLTQLAGVVAPSVAGPGQMAADDVVRIKLAQPPRARWQPLRNDAMRASVR